jgi:hypothetical protein
VTTPTITIQEITVNNGANLDVSTIFSLLGSVTDTLKINNVVVNDTSTIGDATILDQVGSVTNKITVDNVDIKSATMDGTIGTAVLFKFTGSCKAIDFLNLDMTTIASTGALTLTQFNYNDYESLTLTTWTLTGVIFSQQAQLSKTLKLVDFTTNAKTQQLKIEMVTIDATSKVRDTTLFDLQGQITSQLNIFPIDITGGTFAFGTGGTEGQTTLINLDVTMPASSVTTIKDWTMNTLTFD